MSSPSTKIFSPYFDYLRQHFQVLANEVVKYNITAGDVAQDFLSSSQRRDSFLPIADEMRQFILQFWRTNNGPVLELIAQLKGLKARFGGDIGPQANDNIIQRAGLYFDTIIVPDPLYRITQLSLEHDLNWHYYILKYAINQLVSADAYLANIDPPIAILVPDTHLLDTKTQLPELIADGEIHTVLAINKLYGINLDSFQEVEKYFTRFSSLKNAISAIQDTELFWFDERVNRNPEDQLASIINFHTSTYSSTNSQVSIENPQYLPYMLRGRMMQVADAYRSSLKDNAVPLISAPISFHWFSFRFSSGQKLVSRELGLEDFPKLVLTNSLLSSNLDWLGKVPFKSLVQLRERGTLQDIRTMFAQTLLKYNDLSQTSIVDATNLIDKEISDALKKHQSEVQQLNQTLKFELSITVPTLLVSIIASLQPTMLPLLPQWVPGVANMIGTGSVAEVLRHSVDYYRKSKILSESPVGILWNAKDKSCN